MGLITTLIREHEAKKQQDFEKHLGLYAQVAGLPNASDELKQWAWHGIAQMSGEKLDIPKKHHGAFGQLLAGLGSLNPMPKDQYQGQNPLPKEGQELAPEVQSKVQGANGKPMPNAPAYQFRSLLTDQEVAERQAQAERTKADAQYGAMYGAQEAAQERKMKSQLALLEQNKDMFAPDEYEQTKASIIAGRSISRTGSTTGMETRKSVKVKTPDGSVHDYQVGSRTGELYPMGGGEAIDWPEGATIVQEPKPVAEPAQLRLLEDSYRILADPNANTTDKQAARRVVENSNATLATKAAAYRRATQNIQIQGEVSGDYGSALPGVGQSSGTGQPTTGSAPTPAHTAPKTPASTPASTPTGTPAPSTHAATKPVESTAKQGADAKPKGPVEVQRLIAADPQVQLAVNSMLGLTKGSRGGPAVMVGTNKGIQKLMRFTGIPDENALKAEVVERDGASKALNVGSQRLAAYDQSAGFVDAMGDAVRQAKAKFGNDPRFWQRVKNNINNHVVGDPETDALVTSINGYQSAYSRVMSGGQMSTAQTHVAAQERAGKVIDAAMKGSEIDAVLKQVRLELDNERNAIVKNNTRLRKQISAPWGQFAQSTEVTQNETNRTDQIQVQIPGQQPGWIHKSQLDNFKKLYPNAKVL